EQKTRQLTVPNIPLNNLANSRVPAMINKMTVSTDQNQVVQFQNGRCTLEGQLLGTTPVSASQVARIRGKVFSTASGKGLNLTELDGTPYHAFESPAPLGFPDIGACDWHVSTFKVDQNLSGDPMSRLDVKQNAPFAPHLGSIEFTSDQDPTGDQLGTLAWVSPSTSGARVDPWKIPSYGSTVTESTHLAPPIFPPGFGEAIVYFMSDFPIVSGNTAQVPCTLPQEFVSHFVEQQAPVRGEAALLHYVDPDTHRNLGEFKLYPDGFITCVPNTGGGPQNLPTNGVFVFSSWVSRYYQLKPVG
nr:Chain A, Major capsid protein [Norovirus Hu/GI.7/TCH-060/USA/2003]4P12_B Chain B, Major capsid protein [Norovirus Hu/GI.7/TCH-060/USA/2003]4P12_C Chain C, Major capsid protein [Norovirus Hu/GI.7/TCH-060/USA/2003]4P12_D Chain D, Major capsid protein [Norovirus Hu/GI.7/TCH-060/USA/2003]4P1V_A Chain A, P domain of VPI [Norovirus Hu/GI.7/TCH-060/USA/2003]4P1V_B Chain B, P domain of VPI [Norovirus Hu/GI.7/TCH-060/USA/2003]4P1V_C Chain C, P domain of VPI [Norovirus Hu/GI.7/TCH-060/USA/2003]4P1V